MAGSTCLWDQLLLPVCHLPVQSPPWAAANAGQVLPLLSLLEISVLPSKGAATPRARSFCCAPWERMLGFIPIKAEAVFAGVFQATHYLQGERHLKNSLIYHVKKRWHIYCYINVIYIVFSVTLTEIFLNFLLLVGKVYQQYLEIWHRVQICNKPTMETGEQDEKQFISDNQLLQYSIGTTRYARTLLWS